MMNAKKQSTRKGAPSSPWSSDSVDASTLTASERLAHELVVRRNDLMPSVARIMDADLSEAARSIALEAFSNSLNQPGDPNRDPRVAIAGAIARTT
jgi:hypothetical protein